MARTCPSCGRENADDVDFCAACGGYLRWEPTRVATPAVQPPAAAPPPAPEQQEQPAPAAPQPPPAAPPPQQPSAAPQPPPAAPPPQQPSAAPPQQPAPAAPPPQPPPPAAQQPVQPVPAQPPPPPEPEAPKKRRWGRKAPKLPGVQGGRVSGPKVRGPRVAAPRVNIGPGGVKVGAPRVQAPRVQAPRVQAPKLKQPRVPTTPKGFLKAFQKLGAGGAAKGGGGSNAGEGPIAAQPDETWHWDAVGAKGGRGKGLLVVLLLLLFAGAGAAAGWYFFVRADEGAAPAAAAGAITPRQFVARLEPLLVRSARDRVRISRAVTRVGNCSLAPGPGARQIGQTIRGRQAVLGQVRRIPVASAPMRRARLLLEQSLARSAAAARDYSLWIASFNGACPVRAGPEYAKAVATNRTAQAAKASFAKTYNPLARSAGGRTWASGQF